MDAKFRPNGEKLTHGFTLYLQSGGTIYVPMRTDSDLTAVMVATDEIWRYQTRNDFVCGIKVERLTGRTEAGYLTFETIYERGRTN